MNSTDPPQATGGQDTSNRRHGEKPPVDSHLLLRAIEASTNGLTIADATLPEMPLIYVNHGFERLTGYSAAECLGRNCRFLHRDDRDQPGLEQVRAALAHGYECRVVLRNYRKDGSLFWNEFHISPIRDERGQLTHFIGIQSDISEQIALLEAREQFFQIASHDLKNPLFSIMATASLIRNQCKVGQPITEQLQDIMLNVLKRAREMQHIIEDYLDLQSLEEGKLSVDLHRFDLAEIARDCIQREAATADRKGITLVGPPADVSMPARGDPDKTMQVAINLLNNAIKFSPPRTEVRIALRPVQTEVNFEVSDQGPGLTPEDEARVFQKYARLSNRPTAGEKSSGLGLFISRMLIEAMGGRIGVHNNTTSRGATFWFSLPRAE